MSIELLQPLLGDGIRSVNFFNGRLLSAEDLLAEQAANRQQHQLLGQAVGEGIAHGLEVSTTAGAGAKAIVTVQPGLAVNRNGAVVRLNAATDVSLVRPQNGSASATGPVFSECQPFQSGIYVTGSGVYLLTLSPVKGQEGRALVSGLQNTAADCNTKYIVDGVQFRLVQLDMTAGELNDQNHLRNLVAYKCFGGSATKTFVSDPFGAEVKQYGLLDSLRPNRLTDCDVPLAVLFWTASGGIKFVDNWPVRRRLTANAANDRWSLLMDDRRASEAEAMFSQFEDQIEDIRLNELQATLASIAAPQRFSFLPPAGLLPVTDAGLLFGANAGLVRLAGPPSPSGFNPQTFFGEHASKDVAITDGDLLRSLLRESFSHEPIDLCRSEKIQLYLIWENVQAVEQGQTSQLALVFASHTLPYIGVARFGRAIWKLSRFAPRVI